MSGVSTKENVCPQIFLAISYVVMGNYLEGACVCGGSSCTAMVHCEWGCFKVCGHMQVSTVLSGRWDERGIMVEFTCGRNLVSVIETL